MTPQKVFMDSIHLWILPLILISFKILFDILPKPVFFGSIALVIIGYYSYGRFKLSQSERTARQLESSADTFLNELNSADKAKRDKEAKKKSLKEQQKQDRLRAQQLKKKSKEGAPASPTKSGSTQATVSADDDDDDAILMRMATTRKTRQ